MGHTLWSRLCAGLVLLYTCSMPVGAGRGGDPVPPLDRTPEYRVKAAFIYNFIKYSTWPEGAFRNDEEPIILTVLGKDPFGGILDATMKGKQLDGRAIRIVRHAVLPETLRSHVVFYSGDATLRRGVLDLTKALPALTIGEHTGDALAGALVGFYLESDKVRFEVNIGRVKEVRLEISSELLKLARIVKSEGRAG